MTITTTHKHQHSLAGKTVKIKSNVFLHGGKDFEVRDWWDRCSGYSWRYGIGTIPVCSTYATRAFMSLNPRMFNEEVVYGKIGSFMYIFHVSELED